MTGTVLTVAEIGGIDIHYRLIGDPARKPAIVFSNSLGTDFRIWRAVADALDGEATLLLYDKRGHGLSALGEAPYSMDDHVADLAGLMDHLGISQALVCGLSVGGLIAQGLYHARPDLVAGLVLSDTATKVGDDAMWNGRIAAIEEGGLEAILDGVMERWFTQGFRTGDATYAAYVNMFLRSPASGYTGTCAAIRDTDYTAQAAGIAVPTACVVGAEDGASPPALVAATAERIPGATFHEIPGAGHIPCVEQPDAVVAILREMLGRVAAS